MVEKNMGQIAINREFHRRNRRMIMFRDKLGFIDTCCGMGSGYIYDGRGNGGEHTLDMYLQISSEENRDGIG